MVLVAVVDVGVIGPAQAGVGVDRAEAAGAVVLAADSFHRVTTHTRLYLSPPFLEGVGRFWNESAVLGMTRPFLERVT